MKAIKTEKIDNDYDYLRYKFADRFENMVRIADYLGQDVPGWAFDRMKEYLSDQETDRYIAGEYGVRK